MVAVYGTGHNAKRLGLQNLEITPFQFDYFLGKPLFFFTD
jgi:hypothetical protein